jgi:hypothetical protein
VIGTYNNPSQLAVNEQVLASGILVNSRNSNPFNDLASSYSDITPIVPVLAVGKRTEHILREPWLPLPVWAAFDARHFVTSVVCQLCAKECAMRCE